MPGVVRKKDWKSKFFRFVASVNIDEYDGKKNSQRIRSNLREMSKKNGEDKNTISIKQISEMIFCKQEKRYFWLIIVEFERKTKLFNEKLFTDSHAQGLFNLNEQGVL